MNKLFIVIIALISITIFSSCSSCSTSGRKHSKATKDALPRIETTIFAFGKTYEAGKLQQYVINVPNGIDARTGGKRTKAVKATLSTKMKALLKEEGLELQSGDTVIVIARDESDGKLLGEYEIIGAHFPYRKIENVY
jgi:hypothetical protein